MSPLHRPFIRNTNWTDHLDAWIRRGTRWLIIANIVLGVFTLFNIYIYPEHIYQPTPVSEPVDQMHPHEI